MIPEDRPDRAAGQLGTTFGIGVLLTLLLFASHLLLDLWLTSSIIGVARDAAVAVASSDASHRPGAAERAVRVARLALGDMAEEVELSFEPDPDGRSVILHVRAPRVTMLPPGVSDVVGAEGLDRRIVVPFEDPGR